MKKKSYKIDTMFFSNHEQVNKYSSVEYIAKNVATFAVGIALLAFGVGEFYENKLKDNLSGYYTTDDKEKDLIGGLKNRFDGILAKKKKES